MNPDKVLEAATKAKEDRIRAEEAKIETGKERMLKWFAYDHLPLDLQNVSRMFHTTAVGIVAVTDPGPERTVALRKLLEAKDAAVRAAVHPGG